MQGGSGRRPRATRTAAEVDAVYARRIYCYLQRAGTVSGIKRQIRRRERRDGKQETSRDEG